MSMNKQILDNNINITTEIKEWIINNNQYILDSIDEVLDNSVVRDTQQIDKYINEYQHQFYNAVVKSFVAKCAEALRLPIDAVYEVIDVGDKIFVQLMYSVASKKQKKHETTQRHQETRQNRLSARERKRLKHKQWLKEHRAKIKILKEAKRNAKKKT